MIAPHSHDLPPMAPPERGRDELGETPRPPHDPSARAVVSALPREPLTLGTVAAARQRLWLTPGLIRQLFDVTHEDVSCPGYRGGQITLAVFRRTGDEQTGPGFVWIHGGGMVAGDRFTDLLEPLEHLEEHGGTLVSIEYRLAPENPAPIPVEDCYAGLSWAAAHAGELCFDPDKVILGGASAGGGLAAGTALLARDRHGPTLAGVQLACPMLDDRNDSTSVRQFDVSIGWSGRSNRVGWTALLGDARGTDAVSPYDAPARATCLQGLPPVQISVGSADPFRSENVAFAENIWRDGGDCELHVLPGGHHGYETHLPTASITRITLLARSAWVRRILHPDDTEDAMERTSQINRWQAHHQEEGRGGRPPIGRRLLP